MADVREVMDHYRQFDDPLEAFRESQRRLQVSDRGETFGGRRAVLYIRK